MTSIPLHFTSEQLQKVLEMASERNQTVEEYCIERVTAPESPTLNYIQRKPHATKET